MTGVYVQKHRNKSSETATPARRMRVAIIGAGAAGVAAARHCLQTGKDVTVFEQGGQIGGTWVYTDDVGEDKYGYPVHSSMYKGLRTNLPKEVMGFPDFPVPERNESYLAQAEILDFLNSFVDKFQLRSKIRLFNHVKLVKPTESYWILSIVNVTTGEEIEGQFEAVMVCNGHYSVPRWPNINGYKSFQGLQFHSHDYRNPQVFRNKKVLIIGGGPSAFDIILQGLTTAKKMVLSHHSDEIDDNFFPSAVVLKPDVKCIRKWSVDFEDESCDDFDIICYCTGYKYSFPFLHESCKISIEDNYIRPLYRHMINIEYPTMCFIGIPFNVCAFHMFDLQARYFLKMLTIGFPAKELMYANTEQDMVKRWKRGYEKWQAHLMGEKQTVYYNDLAREASIKSIAPVIVKLREDSAARIVKDLLSFRNDVYRILDDENYVKINV